MKKERIGRIYVIHNLVNDKEYVGQTVRKPEIRWAGHIKDAERGDRRPLYCAIRKYGLSNFSAEVIWVGPESKLNAAEKRYVRRRRSFIDTGWGYNLTTGGGHYKLSVQTRKKIAKATRAGWANTDIRAHHAIKPETRKKMSLACCRRKLTGEYHSVASRKKIAVSNKKVWKREGYKAARKKKIALLWAEPEAHTKMSAAAKVRCTTEWRADVSNRWLALWAKPAHKKKHKAALKAAYADPVAKAMRVAACNSDIAKARRAISIAKYWNTPGVREARSAITKTAQRRRRERERRLVNVEA